MVFWLALSGCSGPSDDGTGPDPTPGVQARLEAGGLQACADPSLRSAQPFDTRGAGDPDLPGAYLHGGGLLVEDLDGDGWMDLLLPGEGPAQLFWGSDGDFVDGSTSVSALPLQMGVGATAVDYDADGDLDVFVTRWLEPDVLLQNDGTGQLTDVSAAAFGAGYPSLRTQSASWADIDADGDLDLFVGAYGPYVEVLDGGDAGGCDDHVSDPSLLWRNEGDGTFVDISDRLPAEVHDGYVFMSGWYDLEGDGYPELFTAHDDGLCQPSVLVLNDGGVLRVDEDSFFSTGNRHDMGMGVADLNGDEAPDFLLTSWNGAYYLQSSTSSGSLKFFESQDSVGLTTWSADQNQPGQVQPGMQVYGWGAEFGDVDNDADLDAVMVFGYWSTYDGAGDPPIQYDGLWVNNGANSFVDEADAWGVADPGESRGLVLADVDNDGFLDVVKRTLDGGSPLHLSRCDDAAWLRVRLQDGTTPNTHGVGATVKVTAGGQTQLRWIHSGSSGMYSGAPLEAHFGLGGAEVIDRLEVRWPDGSVDVFEGVDTRQQVQVIR